MKINTRLILLLSFLSIIIILLCGFIFLIQSEKFLNERIESQFESIAVLKENQFNQFVDMGVENVGEIIKLDEIKTCKDLDEEKIIEILNSKLIHTRFDELFIVDLDGEVKFSTNPDQVGKIKIGSSYFNEGKKGIFIQNFYYGVSVHGPTMVISTPIKGCAEEVTGVLVGRINPQEISYIMLERSGLGLTGETYLINKFNFVVSELKNEKDAVLKKIIHNEPLKDCLNKNNGFDFYEDYSGNKVVGLYSWIEEREVCLFVQMDEEEVFQPIKKLRILIAWVMCLVILFCIFISFFISRAFSRPINNLSQKVDEISKGKLDIELRESNIDELNILIGSLNRVLASLKLAILRTGASKGELGLGELKKAKKEAEEKYKILYETSSDALMTLAPPNWNFTAGNPATVKMFGAKDEKEFLSKTPGDLSPKNQPDGVPSGEKAKTMIMKAMKEGSNFFKWTHKRINGEEFPATVLLTKIKLEGKELLQATVRDLGKAGKEKAEMENLARRYLDLAGVMILSLDAKGAVTLMNQKGAEILGYKNPSEIIGKNWFDNFVPKEIVKEIKKVHDGIMRGKVKSLEYYENEIITRDGIRKTLSFHNTLLKNDGGKIEGVLSSGEEVNKKGKISGAGAAVKTILAKNSSSKPVKKVQLVAKPTSVSKQTLKKPLIKKPVVPIKPELKNVLGKKKVIGNKSLLPKNKKVKKYFLKKN